jgi:polyisoprenoid-binding protein YceI
VETHPDITFVSDRVDLTGRDTAEVSGTLTLLGVARPVTLDVRFNAGYGPNPYEPNGRIGFSASAELLRSDFGMAFGIPPPGSDFGVGDRVTVRIEAEFVTPQPIRQ